MNTSISLPAKIRDYVKGTTSGLSNLDILQLSMLLLLGISMTWAYIFFASVLGFNVNSSFQVALLALLFLLALMFNMLGGPISTTLFHNTTLGLVLVLAVTCVLRLFFALSASLFPDEYWVLLVLRGYPLRNLGYFIVNYVSMTGRYASHPPLSFLLMSLGYEVLPTSTGARIVSVILGTASVAVVYYVLCELNGQKYALSVAALYGLLPQTLLYMSVALTDVYMNFFGLLSLLLGLRALRTSRAGYSTLSGISLGMSLLSKQGLGIFWGIMLLFATAVFRPKRISTIRGFGYPSLSLIVGIGLFSLWYFANPLAFWLSVGGVLHYVTTVPSNPQAYNFGQCCFQVVNGMTAHISYPDLIVQLPVWLTPLVVILGLLGILVSVRSHRRRDAWWMLWSMGPLLAMIPGIRDIRYALFIAPAAAYLAFIGVEGLGAKVRRIAVVLMVIFLVVFISITAAVAQQQYWGVQEASAEINRLGFGRGVVLTNVPETMYSLPQAKILILEANYNWTQVDQLILTENVTAIIVIHNARAPWPIIPVQVTNGMRSLFTGYESNAISGFASYEIFYARR